MSHDNENKRIEVKYKGKKYKVIEVIIDMPEYPVFQRKSVDQIELVTEEIASTTPSEVSTFDSALDEILKYSKSDFCPGCGLTKEGLRIIREETKREVLQDMRQYTHYGVDFLDRVEQYAVEKGINLSEQ